MLELASKWTISIIESLKITIYVSNTPIAIKSNNLRGLKFIFSFVWEIYENQNEIKDVKTLYIFWFIWFKSGSVFELITVKGVFHC